MFISGTGKTAAVLAATLAALLIFCGSRAVSPAELKHKPWIEKDWTQWSPTDCEYVRKYSPWADYDGHETAPSESANGQTEHYWAQLLSSLPIREANLRELQIAKSYSRMNPAKNWHSTRSMAQTFQKTRAIRSGFGLDSG
jgi:hypothetical protein